MTATTTRRAAGLRGVTGRHQVTVFVLLTMAVSWLFIPFTDGALLPYGPMFAGFVILAVVSGRRAMSSLWRQMTRWRVGWKWYLIAPGLFVVMHSVALALCSVIGVDLVGTAPVLSMSILLGVWLPLVFTGGQWEEPGWLGYLVRRLQDGLLSLWRVLVVAGLIRMVWHTPLVLAGTIPWYDYIFGTFALQIILLWLYNRTGGSVLIPMLAHLFSNLTLATFLPLVSEPDQGLYWFIFNMTELAVGLGLILVPRDRLGSFDVARRSV